MTDEKWSEKSKRSSAEGRASKRPATGGADGRVVRTQSDSGARKVAKAAATAGQRDVSFVSRLGFPAVVSVVCLLGIGSVLYAWQTREALVKPVQNLDHWHSVYGFYDCTVEGEDKYLAPFQAAIDPVGIHSHGDGLIHIHPFFEVSSGNNATVRHFFEAMGVEFTPEKIVLDTGRELVAGTECADGSGPAEVRLLRWRYDRQALAEGQVDPSVVTSDFGSVKFRNDREVYIFAFASPDADVPLPPQSRFDLLNTVAPDLDYNPVAESVSVDGGSTVQLETGVDEEGTTVTTTVDDSGATTDDSGAVETDAG